MQTSQKDFRIGSINYSPDYTSTRIFQGISLLKQLPRATSPVHTAQEKKSRTTWTLTSSQISLTRLVCMELEALASICSGNHFSTHLGSKPSSILEEEIKETLFSSLRTVRYLTDWLIKLSKQIPTKYYGAGDRKRSSRRKRKRN